MKKPLNSLLFTLIFIIPAFGQQQIYLPWEFAGGPPCPINDVVVHNGIVYAATDCGLYKRPGNDDTWQRQPNTPDSTVLFVAANAGAIVAVFRQDSSRLEQGGLKRLHIFNSLDNGNSFTRRYSYDYNFWSPSSNPHAPGPTDITQLYALGDSSFAVSEHSCPQGCYYAQIASTNNGQTWSRHPLIGYYQSHLLNPYTVKGDSIAVFNFDSLQFLNASSLQYRSSVKIPFTIAYEETAAGLSWVNNRITVTFRSGLYAYTDNLGQNWTTESLPFSNINDFFYYENYYYWVTDSGFYRSPTIESPVPETLYLYTSAFGKLNKVERGTNGWYLLTNTMLRWLPDGTSDAALISNKGVWETKGTLSCLPGRLMFRNEYGLWWQSPDGETWSIYDNETAQLNSFQQYYTDDSISLALSLPTTGLASIYRSIDNGATWSISLTNLSPYFLSSRVFFKNRNDGRIYFDQYFTDNGGLTWQSINLYVPNAALGDTLLSLSYIDNKISFDHGQNWQNFSLHNPSTSYKFVLANRAIFAIPSYPYDTVYRSYDFGNTWQPAGLNTYYDTDVLGVVRIGQTTWVRSKATLGIIPDANQHYWLVNTPFASRTRWYLEIWEYGGIVQKDNTVYAAYNGGIWRTSSCYTEHPAPSRDTTICQGNIVLFHGDTLRTTGTYTQAISNLNTLCDSLDVLHLQVNLIKTNWYKQICAGDTLLWNNQAYSGNGVFTQLFSTPTSCDSSVTLYLSNYYTIGQSSMAFCAGDVIQAYGDTISAPGHYIFHLTSFLGCDSTLLLHVYDAQDTFIYSPVICAGAEYSLYGHTYTETGEYWFSRTAISSPCPTIYHIFLTVQPDEVIALDTFVTVGTIIYGHTINSDTIFTVLVAGPNSCDKITTITVHTTVGTDNLNAEQAVQAFPNPFRDQLTLRWSAGEIAQVRLYDARGQLWREGQLGGPKAVWNTGDLPTGLYRVEFLFGEQRYNWKVVKVP